MIYVIMGVCGSGKTVVGELLAEKMNCEFRDGDEFHSEENKKKMSSGIPLTDQDRKPWLLAIHEFIKQKHSKGETVVVACSALKRSYRDILRFGLPENRGTGLSRVNYRLIFLKGDKGILTERLKGRKGHFMPAKMLESQLSTLEEPDAEEDCLTVNIAGSIDSIIEEILNYFSQK